MGLLTSDQKAQIVQTKESKQAGKTLSGLMQQDINIPQQQIAGMNPLTQQALDYYSQITPQINQYYQQAGQTLMGMAQGQDPYSSPIYQNLRSEGERMANQAGTKARQSSNMGGALFSTPSNIAESNARSMVDTALLSTYGDMIQQDQNRQMAAAQGLQGLGQAQAQQAGMQANLGQIQQQQQQAQFDAIYNQVLQQTLAPFQYQAQIASSLYNPQTVVTGGGMSDMGALLGVGGGIVAGMAAGGTGFFA